MRRRTFLFLSVSICAAPAFAGGPQASTAPRDIVARVYELAAGPKNKYDVPSPIDSKIVRKNYLSSALDRAIQQAYARSRRTNEPVIDFDPVMNTQEQAEPKNLRFEAESESADKAVVAAKFENYASKVVVRYDFVREKGAWRIDDLRGSVDGKDEWSLRKIATGG